MHNFVHAEASVAGTHSWPDAPKGTEEYLKHPHRHLFKVEADLLTDHGNRAVEVNELSRNLQHFLVGCSAYNPKIDEHDLREFGSNSCEQLAVQVAKQLEKEYPQAIVWKCVVLEDGILGGGVVNLARVGTPTQGSHDTVVVNDALVEPTLVDGLVEPTLMHILRVARDARLDVVMSLDVLDSVHITVASEDGTVPPTKHSAIGSLSGALYEISRQMQRPHYA